jgi:hypothetical protein
VVRAIKAAALGASVGLILLALSRRPPRTRRRRS